MRRGGFLVACLWSCVIGCSQRRHGQDKTVLSCPCRRREQAITLAIFRRQSQWLPPTDVGTHRSCSQRRHRNGNQRRFWVRMAKKLCLPVLIPVKSQSVRGASPRHTIHSFLRRQHGRVRPSVQNDDATMPGVPVGCLSERDYWDGSAPRTRFLSSAIVAESVASVLPTTVSLRRFDDAPGKTLSTLTHCWARMRLPAAGSSDTLCYTIHG